MKIIEKNTQKTAKMNENTPNTEPKELFTLFAYTSKHVRAGYYKLIDYTNNEFRATRTEAIAKAKAYFEAIKSNSKSVTLLAYTFNAGKFTQAPIFNQETI